MRVARIPFLNSAPFYGELPAAGLELLDLPPRQLGEAARAEDVDAGILSLCDTFGLPDFEPLGDLGISVPGAAHSVLLLSRRPPDELAGVRIGVTGQTATSIRLAELLLRARFGVAAPRLERGPQPEDESVLLIGDRALREAAREGVTPDRSGYGPGPVRLPGRVRWTWMLDLAAEWRAWQGLPFVFARWMVRRGAPAAGREALLGALERSLAAAERDLTAVAIAHAGTVGLTPAAATAYLRGFRYRFGADEERAVARFRELLGAAVEAPALATTREQA